MLDFKQIQNKVAQMEKEIWHLYKNIIPAIESQISSSSGAPFEELQKQLDEHSQKLQSIEENLSSFSSSLSALQSQVESNGSNIQSNSSQIESMKSEISSLSSSLDGISSSLSSLQSAVQENSQNIQTNSQNIASASAKADSNSTQIGGLNDLISALSTRVENLEKSGGGGGGGGKRTFKLIYDKDNSSLNAGKPDGIVPGGDFTWSENFSAMRFYASLGGYAAFVELPLENRTHNDLVLQTVNATGLTLNIYKGNLNASTKRVNMTYAFTYEFSTSATTVKFTRSNSNTKFFISKIEGIIE